jgi:hypothetical protein
VWSLDLVYQKVPVAQPVIPADDEDEVEVVEDTTLARRARDKRLDPIRVSRAEWSVYELVDGRRTVAELNELAFLSEFDGCKACFDLVSRGLIEEAMPRAVEAPDEPGMPLGAPAARSPRVPVDLNVIAGVALALVLAVAVRFQSKNPLNLVTLPPRPEAVIQGYEKSVSLLKLRRLAEGVDTYTLLSGRLPEALETLVASQIVQPRDLEDPWGTRYRYIVQGEKFYLVGFDPEGHTDPDLLFSRTLVLRETKEQELAPHSSREITVVE